MLESLFNKVAINKILNNTAFFIEHLSCLLLEKVCCERDLIRCSRPESFYNIDVRKNFAKFTGKTLGQSISPDVLSHEHLFYRTHPVAEKDSFSGTFWNILQSFPEHQLFENNKKSSPSFCFLYRVLLLIYVWGLFCHCF